MSSQIFDMHNVFCITTDASKKLVVIEGEFSSKENVLQQLCQRVIELENNGHVVSSVVALNSDGSRPRIQIHGSEVYKAIKKSSHADELTGRYAKLAKDLKAAHEYGLTHMGTDDGGSCNFDSPTLYLPRWNKEKVEAAVKKAGLSCFEWRPFGATKFWVISVPGTGQGHTRTNAAEAMSAYLGDVGYDAGMYCQSD